MVREWYESGTRVVREWYESQSRRVRLDYFYKTASAKWLALPGIGNAFQQHIDQDGGSLFHLDKQVPAIDTVQRVVFDFFPRVVNRTCATDRGGLVLVDQLFRPLQQPVPPQLNVFKGVQQGSGIFAAVNFTNFSSALNGGGVKFAGG